jgi:hypothetical protein
MALAELAHAQAETQSGMQRLERNLDRLSTEMREFKDEMREFKDEMREFKDEMREFKDEMSVFKDEMRASSKAADKRWGELSNKMGTLVEDIIAPGIPEVLRNLFQTDQEAEIIVRTRRRHRESGARREFDTAAWIDGYFLLSETKSRLTPGDIPEFLEILAQARSFFSEAQGRKVIGALATFYVDASLVAAIERAGLIAIGLDTGLLRLLNSTDFRPAEF